MSGKKSIVHLQKMKTKEKIACLTAYDYTSALIADGAGMDLILVGDSLGMVIQGKKDTLGVTVDDIIYHTKMVMRGVCNAFIVADMPFGSFSDVNKGVDNALKVIRKTGADAVKMEGAGETVKTIIKNLLDCGVVSVGHIGLKPQMYNLEGGYKVQGYKGHDHLVKEALELEEAGAKLIVLEGVTSQCAVDITNTLKIPTIGIGAGVECDGQILVYHDIFGFYDKLKPKFVKEYFNAAQHLGSAAAQYVQEVKNKIFPAEEHTYHKK